MLLPDALRELLKQFRGGQSHRGSHDIVIFVVVLALGRPGLPVDLVCLKKMVKRTLLSIFDYFVVFQMTQSASALIVTPKNGRVRASSVTKVTIQLKTEKLSESSLLIS